MFNWHPFYCPLFTFLEINNFIPIFKQWLIIKRNSTSIFCFNFSYTSGLIRCYNMNTFSQVFTSICWMNSDPYTLAWIDTRYCNMTIIIRCCSEKTHQKMILIYLLVITTYWRIWVILVMSCF